MTNTDQIIKALCNTLVNSLWQGIILAAVAGIIVIATRKSTSAMRYNLLTGALALFAIGSVVTFCMQFNFTSGNSLIVGNSGPALQEVAFNQPVNTPVVAQSGNILSTIGDYLNSYHNTIVFIWFMIICIKSIQFGVGLYGTYTLKTQKVSSPAQFWKERAMQLACITGVKQVIDILESGLAKVPMVVGHLKPVILVPVGMLAALSPAEIEAIIIHELAHIKRRDYLVNMLQSLMEIVFFFNPAVLWISNLIKIERENCCDDIALAQNGNKSSYIHALVLCEEFQSAIPAYAMALAGNKGSLLNRVKRMANNRNNSLNQFEKAFLAICLVMSGLCFSAFAAKDEIKHTVHEVVKVLQHTAVYKAEQTLIEQTDKLKQQAEKLKQQTALVEANTPALNENDDQMDTTKKRVNVVVDPQVVVNADPQVAVNVNPQVAPNVVVAPVNVRVAAQPMVAMASVVNVNPQVNVSVRPQLANLNVRLNGLNSRLNALSDTINYRNSKYNRTFRAIVQELYKMKIVTDTNKVTLHLNERELNVNGVREPDDVHKIIFEKFGKDGVGYGYQNNYNGNSNVYPGANSSSSSSSSSGNSRNYNGSYSYSYNSDSANNNSAARARSRATAATRATDARIKSEIRRERNEEDAKMMADDLLKDGLIKDAENYSFSITDKVFIVNGKKQPDAIFEKYKKKYATEGTWSGSHSHN